MVSVVVHCNPGLQNQIDCADALRSGFAAAEMPVEVVYDRRPQKANEITVIQGPWWAYNEFIGKPNVLWLDRTFYGCAVNNVSLGWLNENGSRDFGDCDKPAKGELPALHPAKEKTRSVIVFGDYGRDPAQEMSYARRTYDSVFYRAHPASNGRTPYLTLGGELETVFAIGDCAVGYKTTALIDAAIHGLHTHSTNPWHVVQEIETLGREKWLAELSWKQWSLDELRAGTFVDHLC